MEVCGGEDGKENKMGTIEIFCMCHVPVTMLDICNILLENLKGFVYDTYMYLQYVVTS